MDQYIAGKTQIIDGKGERVWVENPLVTVKQPKLKGKLYLIVGPSGTGKSTLARELSKRGIPEVLSYTTRSPRLGEIEGVNYHYVTREFFLQMVARGEFIEHVEYNGNLYGSARNTVLGLLEKGDATIVVEGHGAEQFHAAFPKDSEIVFLYPPSDEELRRRLELRGDKPEVIDLRMKSKAHEVEFYWKWERSGLISYSNRIQADTVEDLVLQVLRLIEEPKGTLRDVRGLVIKPGQQIVYASTAGRSSTLTVAEVVKLQPTKKVTWNRDNPKWKVIARPLGHSFRDRVPHKDVVLAFPTRICVVKDVPDIHITKDML